MLNQSALVRFYEAHGDTLRDLAAIQTAMNEMFHDAEDPIRAICLAALSGEPCLLVGPPGDAKTQMIRQFCRISGVPLPADDATENGDRMIPNGGYFEYLLTPFTEPTELFGAFQIQGIAEGKRLERQEDGMLHRASVAFLDEVFNGSGAILNTLLALINERIFHDRGRVKKADLKVLFGATNSVANLGPESAIFDRFTLRARVESIDATPSALAQLLSAARRSEADSSLIRTGLMSALDDLRRDFDNRQNSLISFDVEKDPTLRNIAYMVDYARDTGLGGFSNRRIVRMVRLMVLHRLFRAAQSKDKKLGKAILGLEDYGILPVHMIDHMQPLDHEQRSKFESLPDLSQIAGAAKAEKPREKVA